ncbi:Ras family GTP-binding protein rho1p [Niveomyces insectorum RCEF 264]|uniref:Ras family GTP-binding protein rho1p n=1 Tax=Niveomyces insectorum RCEF 264 TaxID=1081102 RepID=A0A167QHA0_9HYPO|nr:Ras family GTP-binding protein rho1p [Niveomyces insectorum RCEF 264]
MAEYYTSQGTPPPSVDRQLAKHPLQPLCASPSPWVAAPPTPQESQASGGQGSPVSPNLWGAVPPSTPTPADDPMCAARGGGGGGGGGLATPTANAPQHMHPIYAAIGPKVRQDVRMQQWLSEIPVPMTPQERYLQGLNPNVDHPLHPRPLQVPPGRQLRYLNNVAIPDDKAALSFENERPTTSDLDKENAAVEAKVFSSGAAVIVDNKPSQKSVQNTKKRQILEEHADSALARKRTRILDPVRRFSQRVSFSLALSPLPEDDGTRDGRSADLSPEDVAKQNELIYQPSRLIQPSKGSVRKLSGRYGTLRSLGSSSVRRMISSKSTAGLAVPKREDAVGSWADGRPDLIVNVAFIGDGRVGKTALIRRLVHGTFPPSYSPSDVQEKTIRLTVDGLRVQLNLSEGGSGRNPGEPSILALGWFSVVVLCFDVGDQSSLSNLQKYRNDVAIYEENSVVVLAGLRKDSRRRLPPLQLAFSNEPTQVAADDGKEAAKILRCANYFECSSLGSCEGVDDLFDFIVHSGVQLQKTREQKMSRFRFEESVDKGMAKIADGVRSLFLFRGNAANSG